MRGFLYICTMITLSFVTPNPQSTIYGGIAQPHEDLLTFDTDIPISLVGVDATFYVSHALYSKISFSLPLSATAGSPEWAFSIAPTTAIGTWIPAIFGGGVNTQNNKQVYKLEFRLSDNGSGLVRIELRELWVAEFDQYTELNGRLIANSTRFDEGSVNDVYNTTSSFKRSRVRAFDFNDRVFTMLVLRTNAEFKYFDDPVLNNASFSIETAAGTYSLATVGSQNLPYWDDFTIIANLDGDGTEVFGDFGLALIRTDVSNDQIYFLDSFDAAYVNSATDWQSFNELDPKFLTTVYGLAFSGGRWSFRADVLAKSLPYNSTWKIISFWKASGLFFGTDGYESHISIPATVNRCPVAPQPPLTDNNITDYINTFPANILAAPRERFRSDIKIANTIVHPILSFSPYGVRVRVKSYRAGTNNVYDFYTDFLLSKTTSTGLFQTGNGLSITDDGSELNIAYEFRAQFGNTTNFYTVDLDSSVTNSPGTSTREWAGRGIDLEFAVIYEASDQDENGDDIKVYTEVIVPQRIDVKPYDVSELSLVAGELSGGQINPRVIVCDSDANLCFRVLSPDEPFTEWFLAGIDNAGGTDVTIREEESFAGSLPQLGTPELIEISENYDLISGVKYASGCVNRAFITNGQKYELTAIRKRAADPTPPVVDCVTCGLRGQGLSTFVDYSPIGAYLMPSTFSIEIKGCFLDNNDFATISIGKQDHCCVPESFFFSITRNQLNCDIFPLIPNPKAGANVAIPFPLQGNSYHAIINVSTNDGANWVWYLNGVTIENTNTSAQLTPIVQANDIIRIYPPRTGTLAFARIYNRALTPSEIASLYNDNDAQTPAMVGILPADIILDTTFNALSGTVATDNSPNLNDGTLTGWSTLQTDAGGGAWTCPVTAVACTTDVPSGYCGLQFVDTGGTTPFVQFDGTAMNFGAADFTVTYELSFDPCYYESLQLGVYTNGASEFLSSIYVDSGDLRVGFRLLDGIGSTDVFTTLCRPECVNNDAYLSVAFVRSGDDGTLWEIYVNGFATQTVINDNTYGGTGLTTVTNLFARSFLTEINPPVISNLRVYDRVLTPTEIAEQYATRNVPTTVLPAEVIYDIPFSEFQGTTAADVSGNGYDGTLVGFGSTTYQNGGAWTCPSNLVQQPIPNAVCDTVCGLKILETPLQSINFPQTGVENYNNNPVTINGWYKSEFTASQGIVKIQLGTITPSPFIEVELRANAVKMRYFRTSAATQTEVVFQFPTPTGVCYHFACIFGETRKANQFRLFINGVQIVNFQELQNDAPPFDLFNIGLGGLEITQVNPNPASFAILRNLSIDDFALTEAQIQRIYNGGVAAPAPVLGGYQLSTSSPDLTIDGYNVFAGNIYAPTRFAAPFTEFEGLNAQDITQYGNDGTLNNYSAGEVAYGGGAWGCAPIIQCNDLICGVAINSSGFTPQSVAIPSNFDFFGDGFTFTCTLNDFLQFFGGQSFFSLAFGDFVSDGFNFAISQTQAFYSLLVNGQSRSSTFFAINQLQYCKLAFTVKFNTGSNVSLFTVHRNGRFAVSSQNIVLTPQSLGSLYAGVLQAGAGRSRVSDFRIYNRVLSDEEIMNIAIYPDNTPLSASLNPNIIIIETDLILEYLFNQTSGNTAVDTSAGGNDGTLVGYTAGELLPGGGAWTC